MKNKIDFYNNILLMFLFIFLIVIGVAINYTNKQMKSYFITNDEDLVHTTARITDIKHTDNSDGSYTIEVYAEVVIDDQELIKKINTVRSDLQVGDKIEVSYDKNNPDNIGDDSFDKLIDHTFNFFDISILLYLAGIIGIIINCYLIYRKILIQKLYDTGYLIKAKIVDVMQDSYIGGYNIYSTWIDPDNNKQYKFKSRMIAFNPKPYLNETNNEEIDVYIKRSNPKVYVVDVREVRDKN